MGRERVVAVLEVGFGNWNCAAVVGGGRKWGLVGGGGDEEAMELVTSGL